MKGKIMIENFEKLPNIMGQIVEKAIEKPIIKKFCMQSNGLCREEIKKTELEFCRLIGYCILFRDLTGIEDYMLLQNKNEQMLYLKLKIAERLGIQEAEINIKKDEIIKYIYNNFKVNGYVFHATNSSSVIEKMSLGLRDNAISEKQKMELLYIEALYRKYAPNSIYSPIGHGATDIVQNKTGWFYDGFPIHSMNYANSPQWFAYLCGKSYVYFDAIPEDKRNGYANRDYKTSLNAVLWLVQSQKMNVQDSKALLGFFQKTWNQYKDTTPCLMFVPAKQIGVNDNISLKEYFTDNGMELLLEEVIEGKVNDGKNYCCHKTVLPQNLSFVDLLPLLPRFEIDKNKTFQKTKNITVLQKQFEDER